MQNLILSEVGDVRATYDVSDNDRTTRSSKVDLAEAAGSTGVGAILGVGISGLVQVVRHRKTGVAYAMKTLRLGRLEDFHKVWLFSFVTIGSASAVRAGAIAIISWLERFVLFVGIVNILTGIR